MMSDRFGPWAPFQAEPGRVIRAYNGVHLAEACLTGGWERRNEHPPPAGRRSHVGPRSGRKAAERGLRGVVETLRRSLCRPGYVSEPHSGYRMAQKWRRGALPSPVISKPDSRLADRFLPGMKKAPQPILADSLRCLVSLFLPFGGQNDQQVNSIHYAHYGTSPNFPESAQRCAP